MLDVLAEVIAAALDFRCVSKSTSICGKMRDPGNEVDFIARTMGCTLGSIQHGR